MLRELAITSPEHIVASSEWNETNRRRQPLPVRTTRPDDLLALAGEIIDISRTSGRLFADGLVPTLAGWHACKFRHHFMAAVGVHLQPPRVSPVQWHEHI